MRLLRGRDKIVVEVGYEGIARRRRSSGHMLGRYFPLDKKPLPVVAAPLYG